MIKLLNYTTTDDVAAAAHWTGEVLDVQYTTTSQAFQRRGWNTVVFTNRQDCKVVLRIHNDTGAVRLRAEPARSGVDLEVRDPYEIELMPDVPFDVLTTLMENLK